MMRKIITVTGLTLLFWLFVWSIVSVPTAVAQPSSAQPLGDARLSLIQGDVVLQTEATGSEWGAAVINTPLVPGTKIWGPGNGRSETQFFDGSYLRSSANTEVDITNLSLSTSGDVIQVGVPQGRVYVNYTGSSERNSVFQVDTPVTSIMSYGPSRFEVGIYEDGYTEVSVLNGSVNVQSQNGSSIVDARTMLSMGSNQVAELSPMRPEDAWIRWNLSRDSALAYRGPSRSYLPTSLSVYGNDFDSHGRWVQTADYGYVWTPLNVAVGWAPYRVGRWCWIGGEYVWVSYEPWGWVPYHYGRWAFLASVGWFWVPPPRTAPVYWSPGFVAWIHTPTYVSWVPLAPGEIYYGRRYYGPNSVNITNVNINKINITNVYRNTHVTNAVTVVSRETFLTGRRVPVANAPANPFRTGQKVAIGGPALKPVKATALPDPVKVVPEKGLPSKEIRTKAVQVEQRAAAVQKNVSVFKPGERVKPMQIKKVEHPKPAAAVKQRELEQPSMQRKGEVSKPSVQGAETGKPPVQQRQFGVAPPHKEELNAPPAGKEQNKSSTPHVVTPQTQRPQSVTPNREWMNTPPTQRKFDPPSAQGGQTGGSSLQKQMGIAPPHGGGTVAPPVHPQGMTQAPVQSTTKPPAQRRELGK